LLYFKFQETHNYQEDKIVNKLDTHNFHRLGIFQIYQEMFLPIMQSAVKFAKRIPGFTSLPLNDQILLMKQGTMAVSVVTVSLWQDRSFHSFKNKLFYSILAQMLVLSQNKIIQNT